MVKYDDQIQEEYLAKYQKKKLEHVERRKQDDEEQERYIAEYRKKHEEGTKKCHFLSMKS